MQEIIKTTRQAIFDEMKLADLFCIFGDIDEVEFWSRLYDLDKFESYDYNGRYKTMRGDMYQHRVNNPEDWGDSWFLKDSRINMLDCSDEDFLKFLSETIHPLVRSDRVEVEKLLAIYNKHLRKNGYEIAVAKTIAEKEIYGGKIISEDKFINQTLEEVSKKVDYLDSAYLCGQIEFMKIYTGSSPERAIGLSKEIIESFCKAVLENEGLDENKINKMDFQELTTKTNEYMELLPKNVSYEKKGADVIKSILHSIANITVKVGELRNLYGDDHGKGKNFKGLTKRHASLVVGLTASLLLFWLETYETKRN